MTRNPLTPAQAARVLGVTPQRIRQLLREGRLPHEATPLGRLIDADAVQRLATERATQHEQGQHAKIQAPQATMKGGRHA